MAPDVAGSIPVIHPISIYDLRIDDLVIWAKLGIALAVTAAPAPFIKVRMQKKAAIVLFFVLLVSSPAFAQDTGTRVPVAHKQVIATNPIGDVLGWYNLEYNRKINESVTFEVSGSTFDFFGDDFRISRASAGARYYPQGAALTGFFFGTKLGVFHYDEDDAFGDDSGNAFLFGAEVGYEWLLGKKRNFHIGVGAGGTRLFGGDVGNDVGVAYPTGRLKIGFAF